MGNNKKTKQEASYVKRESISRILLDEKNIEPIQNPSNQDLSKLHIRDYTQTLDNQNANQAENSLCFETFYKNNLENLENQADKPILNISNIYDEGFKLKRGDSQSGNELEFDTEGCGGDYGCYEESYTWKDGTRYIGQWKDRKLHGRGTYLYPDGRIYEGEFWRNRIHGKGVFSWTDGRKYIGDYVHGKREGFGEFHWKDGRVYLGFWKDSKQEGLGKYIDSDRVKIGRWRNGKRIAWLAKLKEDRETRETREVKVLDRAGNYVKSSKPPHTLQEQETEDYERLLESKPIIS